MTVRVVVIGGSLGGLLAGNLLHRAGCDVTVHERIGTELAGRGVGIATHPELHAAFERLGIPVDYSFGVPIEERITIGTSGRILARYHLAQVQATWGSLYHSLLRIFPKARYVAGVAFERAEQCGDRVLAHFEDGTTIEADLLVGADGMRSTVRAQHWPGLSPGYAGYIAWRGVVDEDRVSPKTRDVLFTHFVVCLPPGEHIVGYPVAGRDGDARPGRRRFNVVWYRPTSDDELIRMLTDETGTYHERGISPDLIDRSLIAEMRRTAERTLPAPFAEVVNLVPAPFFQTITDLEMPHMVQGRVVLLGDGAFVARPHAGMGVIKATGDAVLLADLIEAFPDDLARALAVYDAERCRYGRDLVRHSRRLGTQIATAGRTDAERELGAYLRRPENVIRAISMPQSSSPLAVLRDDGA